MKLISAHIYDKIGRKGGSTDFKSSKIIINPNHIIKIDDKIPSEMDNYEYKMTFCMSDGSTIENIYSWIEVDFNNMMHSSDK